MHVDDNLMAERRQFMVRAVAASIEALCQILGKPEEHCRRDAMLIEKIIESICSHTQMQLGRLIHTQDLILMIPDCKREKSLNF